MGKEFVGGLMVATCFYMVVALIILIDTFKSVLYVVFPGLELMIFSLFETLKDIQLFIKDLI